MRPDERGFHDGVSYVTTIGKRPRVWYRCCSGKWPARKCRCPRFRLAIAQLSDLDHVEDSGRP